MVRIITKEELKEKLLTSQNLYVVDWKTERVYNPWSLRIDTLLALLEKDSILCFEVEEEDEG